MKQVVEQVELFDEMAVLRIANHLVGEKPEALWGK
jgi:hypothetical protein